MDATLNKQTKEIIDLIDEMKGLDTVALNMQGQCSWADLMFITTATSTNHMRGIVRRVKDYINEKGLIVRNTQRLAAQEGWTLLDCNDFVIHVMSAEFRDFYELEERWFNAEVLYSSKSL